MDETFIRDAMFRTMGLPLITYVPLQVAAILIMKHWGWRIAAALPLIPMVPVIYAGFDPDAYGHGSLYGVGLYLVYIHAMVYLAIFCLVGLVNWIIRANRQNSATSTENDKDTDVYGPILIVLLVLAVIALLGLMFIPFR